MNAQEKKLHIDITWGFIKSALLLLATLLGKDGLIEKIKALLEGNDDLKAESEGCGGVPMPTNKPTPFGSWQCRNGAWVWIPELG